MKPFLTVIMLNYNGKRFLRQALDSVLKSSYPNFEIIFVDNASRDGSVEYIKQIFGHVRNLKIVENDENYGYAQGNNIGIEHVDKRSKYIVFLNMDVIVEPTCLEGLVNVMEANPDVGATQCKVLLMDNRNVIDSAGHFLDFLGYTYQRGENESDKGQYDDIREICYPYGAAFILRRCILGNIAVEGKLFEPSYFCYHEDADLGWRIRLGGYRILYNPSSVVFHAKGGAGLRYDIGAQAGRSSVVFHLTKNRIMTLLRNYSLSNLLKFLPILLSLGVARAVLVSPFMVKHSMVTIKAIFWVLRNLKGILKKRLLVQQCIRRVSDSHIMQFMFEPNLVYNLSKFRLYLKLA